jgi:hypothetical protein
MSDEIILKKLEHRLNRRSFLRGSGLAAASIAALGMPRHAAGQDLPRDQDKDKKDEPTGDKPADPPAGNTDAGKPEEDEFKITRKDGAASIGSARSAATTCTARIAPGRARTAGTAISTRDTRGWTAGRARRQATA